MGREGAEKSGGCGEVRFKRHSKGERKERDGMQGRKKWKKRMNERGRIEETKLRNGGRERRETKRGNEQRGRIMGTNKGNEQRKLKEGKNRGRMRMGGRE